MQGDSIRFTIKAFLFNVRYRIDNTYLFRRLYSKNCTHGTLQRCYESPKPRQKKHG